jgi:MYXO-CTERM domain-containing protein
VAPVNSVSFAPLRVGFHAGTYDAFNSGQPAGDAIISVAEGGTGSAWFPAFAADDPTAVLGTVGAGPLRPGESAVATFRVDTRANPFFTFANMVLPSNDLFLGNDSPTAFRLFAPDGTLAVATIRQRAGQIWDAGSELPIPANAAFVVGGDNDLRESQGGVVAFDRSELAAFDGRATGGGYVYDDARLAGDPAVFEIGFQAAVVPAPPAAVLGLVAVAGLAARRRLAATAS